MSSQSWKSRRKVVRELKRNAAREPQVIRDVKQTALEFAILLQEHRFGKETLEDLIDEVYSEVPEIDEDKFWYYVHDQFGSQLVSELVIDVLADHLQEEFNRQFSRTDLEFDNTGDIVDFLITEPGKICAGLPTETTIADMYELFLRLTTETFGEGNIPETGIDIYWLVAEGLKDTTAEYELNLDTVLDGEDIRDSIHECILPAIKSAGTAAFLMYQNESDFQIEDSGEDDTQK